jgi:predicted  nucleic acid-binding Zn-ribbon protein
MQQLHVKMQILKRCEALKEKINALKLERKSIEDKLLPIRNKIKIAIENKIALKDKIANLERNKTFGDSYFKALIKKKENGIEFLTSYTVKNKLSTDFNKINLSLNKTKINIIKVK